MPPHHRKVLGLISAVERASWATDLRCRVAQRTLGRTILQQSPLPQLPSRKDSGLARQADRQAAAGATFCRHFYRSQGTAATAARQPGSWLRGDLQAGSQTIRTLLGNPKNLGSQKIGFFGVLHTWGRDLKDYHPHVHFVVPGGGVSPDGSKWLQVNRDQLFHPLPAKMLYKKQFVEEIRKAGLVRQLPYGVLKFDWVVNIKPVGGGQAVLKYLAPYVYRIAITNNRIVSVTDEEVVYRVKPSASAFRTGDFGRSFRAGLCPAHPAAGISESPLLRLHESQLPVAVGRRSLADLVVARLDVLARQRSVSAASFRSRSHPNVPHCGGELELIAMTNAGSQAWSGRKSLSQRGPPCD